MYFPHSIKLPFFSSYPPKNMGPPTIDNLWKSGALGESEIRALTPEQVKVLVQCAACAVKNKKEALAFLELIAKSLPIDKIEDAIRIECLQSIDAFVLAKEINAEGSSYLTRMQPSMHGSLIDILKDFFRALMGSLEDFLRSFGLIDFFHPLPYTRFSEKKSQQVMMLSTLFSSLTSSLVPILGPAHGGAIAGGVFLSFIMLAVSHSKWRPMPTYLPFLENWSEKFKEDPCLSSSGRKEVLDRVVDHLAPVGKNSGCVMLVGKSRVGKTEMIKSLASSIRLGEYPQLKGKQIYYVNTADLFVPADWLPEGQNILTFFAKEMGRHRENVIIVLDQIHVACQAGRALPIADQLKAMLDFPTDFFPHVIAVTTQEDYYRDIYPKHGGLVDRFHCVIVEETKKEESFYIMSEALLKQAPEVFLEEGALAYLLEKATLSGGGEVAMPAHALNLLSKCIQKVSHLQKTNLERKVQGLKRSLEAQRVKQMAESKKDLSPSREALSIHYQEQELCRFETELKQEQKKGEHLFELRNILSNLKKMKYEFATKVIHGKNEKEKRALLLLNCLFIPALESEILSNGDLLGLRMRIDKELIDQVLKEEMESQQKLLRKDWAKEWGKSIEDLCRNFPRWQARS